MPRIEIIPTNWDNSRGDGTPTVDVCQVCKKDFTEGEYIPGNCSLHVGDIPEGIVGETEVEHPPYSECEYECEVCGNPLTNKDD
jgi:hypothetical protein